MPVPSADPKRIECASAFVFDMLNRAATYHQHKESAVYAGITLFAGVAGAGTISGTWPPDWGRYSVPLALGAVTLLWLVVLMFLRFQLTRRRWAALRVAACERLLAAWIQDQPSDEALAYSPSTSRPPPSLCDTVANWAWGCKAAVRAVDTAQSTYPSALVNELLDQERRGTDALIHERLILLTGWALYGILILTVLVRQGVDIAV